MRERRTMREKIAVVLCVVLICSLTACGHSGDAKNDGKYHVGICQWVEHVALDEATRGFQEALTDKLQDKVIFDVQIAQGSTSECQNILNGFVSGDVDLIMANATSALTAASKATNTIPIVATSITDYGTALNMREWNGASGINVTGTSDLAPIESQADLIRELVPNAEKVGILYCSAETNSIFQAQVMGSILTAKGIAFENYTITNKDELEKTVRKAASACDVLYIPTDNTIASQAELLKTNLLSEKLPMIAGEEGLCEAGIATLSISYYDLGVATGEMAAKILTGEADISEMPIEYAPAKKLYNAEICRELGVTVPEGYEAITE